MTTDYKETFDRLSLYFLAILISPILFGTLIATYSVIIFDDSWGFGATIIGVTLYSFPIIALAAFPVSLYIDFSARTKSYPSWIKALLYAGFGTLLGLLGSLVLYDLDSIMSMVIFGIIGGVSHFFILALIKKVIK